MNNNIQPNSPNWLSQKKGKFSASGISKLFTAQNKIADNDTSRGYCFEKALELMYGYENDISFVKDIQRGIELEPLAKQHFKQKMAMQFIDVTDSVYFEIDENSCATPDGLVGSYGVVDYKCPTELNFWKIVDTGEISNSYFLQLQMQMLAVNRSTAYLHNYCIIHGNELGFTVEIKKDEKIISLIKEAIAKAVVIREQKVYELKYKILCQNPNITTLLSGK